MCRCMSVQNFLESVQNFLEAVQNFDFEPKTGKTGPIFLFLAQYEIVFEWQF